MKPLICPKCSHRIKFKDFLLAPTPLHIKCRSCQNRLMVRKYVKSALLLGVFAGLSIGCFIALSSIHPAVSVPLAIGIIFLTDVLYYIIIGRCSLGLKVYDGSIAFHKEIRVLAFIFLFIALFGFIILKYY